MNVNTSRAGEVMLAAQLISSGQNKWSGIKKFSPPAGRRRSVRELEKAGTSGRKKAMKGIPPNSG